MIKAIVFLRVSTNKQTLEQQQSAMMQIALKDFKESEIAIIEGKESASKLDRDQRQTLTSLFNCIKENPSVTRVYFYAVDRLSRKAAMVSVIADELADMHIDCYFHNPFQLHTLTPDGKRNPIADMMLYFLGKGAEMETNLRVQRVEDKRKEMVSNGQIATGKVLLGYFRDPVTKKAVIDEESAQYIRMMFDMYVSGEHSLSTIGDKMIQLGVLKNTGKKTVKTDRVRSILTNLSYSGRENDNTKYPYPAIVSPELQDKVIKMLSDNFVGEKKDTNTIYYAKGLLFSKYTNHAMCLWRASQVYRTSKDDSIQLNIGINAAEWIVKYNTLQHLSIFNSINRQHNKQHLLDNIEKNNQSIERLDGMIEDLNKQFNRLYNMFKKGLVPVDAYENDVKDNRKQMSKLEGEIAKLKSENAHINSMMESPVKDKEIVHINDVELNDEMIRDLARKIFKKVFISKLDDGHFLIEFENQSEIPSMGISIEYWAKGGYPHIIQHRDSCPSSDITVNFQKRFDFKKK